MKSRITFNPRFQRWVVFTKTASGGRCNSAETLPEAVDRAIEDQRYLAEKQDQIDALYRMAGIPR